MTKVIKLQGSFNFRDLGGYATSDRKQVKQGLLYRADELAGLTEADKKIIEGLNIKTIVDFRSDFEVEMKPDPIINGAQYVHIPALPGMGVESSAALLPAELNNLVENADHRAGSMEQLMGGLLASGQFPIERVQQFFVTTYEQLPFQNKAYQRMFQLLADEENLAMVQHCTAGKDRTGVGSALILLLLGVPEEIILADYMITNDTLQPKIAQLKQQLAPLVGNADLSVVEALYGVDKRFLQATFQKIKQTYGSYTRYFEVEFQLTASKQAAIKEKLLD
ncbi:tyrosine-protein phosphatase [Paenibacillus yanchengensis]|uniref:Tyrosine-protein phosphatase n=1 Tax=Paenibacillus yanchengensis TaxID=2035833 RepID=A0ABW4YG35_9BACL